MEYSPLNLQGGTTKDPHLRGRCGERRVMFASTWTWVAPLVGAAGVFGAVLWTTPPGFGATAAVMLGTPRVRMPIRPAIRFLEIDVHRDGEG